MHTCTSLIVLCLQLVENQLYDISVYTEKKLLVCINQKTTVYGIVFNAVL